MTKFEKVEKVSDAITALLLVVFLAWALGLVTAFIWLSPALESAPAYRPVRAEHYKAPVQRARDAWLSGEGQLPREPSIITP